MLRKFLFVSQISACVCHGRDNIMTLDLTILLRPRYSRRLRACVCRPVPGAVELIARVIKAQPELLRLAQMSTRFCARVSA